MRWKAKHEKTKGDERKKSGFLLLPRQIAGEWRWLEYATWIERYNGVYEENVSGIGMIEFEMWEPVAWGQVGRGDLHA